MLVKITNGLAETFTVSQFRKAHPQTSFPQNIPERLLAEYGFYPLRKTERPSAPYTKTVREAPPEQIDGQWVQVWQIIDASSEEVEKNRAEQEAAVRLKRDSLLRQSDWLVLRAQEIGESLSPDWADYRRALRDISKQSDFPFNVVWPQKP